MKNAAINVWGRKYNQTAETQSPGRKPFALW